MQARDIMVSSVNTIGENETVRDVARLLVSNREPRTAVQRLSQSLRLKRVMPESPTRLDLSRVFRRKPPARSAPRPGFMTSPSSCSRERNKMAEILFQSSGPVLFIPSIFRGAFRAKRLRRMQ
jgi:hypothetical protein